MILVDTSVWIDHLHSAEPLLQRALEVDQVAVHPFVVAELALGSIARRGEVLGLLANLRQAASLTPEELLSFVDAHQLWGRGLSLVDAHLLGSVTLMPRWQLWTRDKRLTSAANELLVPTFDDVRTTEQEG